MKSFNKSELRLEYKQKRKQMTKDDVVSKSKNAQKMFLKSKIYQTAKTIMLYMPLGNETDTWDIVLKAFEDKNRVVIPVTDDKTGVITPCYITKDTEYKVGAFNIKEPTVSDVADVCNIDVILVPGIAFAKSGERIGFGKGCYDMLLKNAKAIKVGYCYDFQVVKEISDESHDINMDYIVTENKITECKKY